MAVTDKDLAALLAYNPGFTPTTSASGNLNLLQDIYSMAGDPILAYQQGLVTPQLLLQTISDQTKSTVYSFDDTDYQSIENRAMSVGGGKGDEILLSAFAQIRGGMSLGGVHRWLIKEWAKQGLTKEEELNIDVLFGSDETLREYEKRWLQAQDAEARRSVGELTFNEKTGEYIGQMDDESARNVLKSYGFSGLLAQPAFWKTIPDDTYAQKALADEAAASAKYDTYQLLNKRLPGQATSAAQSAYKDFMSNIPSGRTYSADKQEEAKRQGLTQVPEMGTREYQEFISKQTEGMFGDGTHGAYFGSGGASAGATSPATPIMDNSNAGIISRLTPQEREYWAKMAQSYAGRGVQTEGQKKVDAAKAEVDKLIASSEENRRLAEENGFNPALTLLSQMPQYAAALSTPAPQPAKAKPRTLSDQEIESMASMIAGGFAG